MRLVAAASVLAMLLLSALAGCSSQASGNSSTSDALQALDQRQVEVVAGTGTIKGVIVDEAIRPVGQATVVLNAKQGTVRSDASGQFVFAGLQPGTYFVAVNATQFISTQTSVDVKAGQVSSVRIQILHSNDPVPYHQVMKYKGFITFSGTIATYATDLVTNGTAGNFCAQCTLYFQNDPTVTTIVYEAVWSENTPPPTGPSAFYWEVELSGSDSGHIESAFENSPILHHLSAQGFWANQTHMQARLTGPAEWVEYNQPFDMFVTLFHVADAPKDWSFVKGSE